MLPDLQKLLSSALCIVGLHRWETLYRVGGWERSCQRCGKRQIYVRDHRVGYMIWRTIKLLPFVLLMVSVWSVSAEPVRVCQGNPNVFGGYGVVDLDDILWILQAFTNNPCRYTAGDTDFPDPNCPADLCSNNCEGVRSIDIDDIMAVLLAAQGDRPWGSICPPITCPPGTNVCRPVADAGPDVEVVAKEPVWFDATGSHMGTNAWAGLQWDFEPCVIGQLDRSFHRFNVPGVYSVRLTVVDVKGRTDSDVVVVTVTERTLASSSSDPCTDGTNMPPRPGISARCWVAGTSPTTECPCYQVDLQNKATKCLRGECEPAAEPGQ